MERDRNGNERPKLKWKPLFDNPALRYILFPFQGKSPGDEDPPKKCWPDVEFSLSIHLPEPSTIAEHRAAFNKQRQKLKLPLLGENTDDIALDVDAAVWVWVNFGGIGARTRRGCGALYCQALAPPAFHSHSEWISWISGKVEEYQLGNTPGKREWPVLSPRRVMHKNVAEDKISAWKTAVGTLREFRQGVPAGRAASTTGKPAGRSHWPEPETIRKLILQQRSASRPMARWRSEQPHIPMGFPRAEFGLPIIFEIPGEPIYKITYAPSDEPTETDRKSIKPTLQPDEDSDRLASPLILRPMMFKDGKAHAMIVCLKVRRKQGAYLARGTHDLLHHYPVGELEIRNRVFSTYPNSPLAGSRLGSAIMAFLSFARSKGFV